LKREAQLSDFLIDTIMGSGLVTGTKTCPAALSQENDYDHCCDKDKIVVTTKQSQEPFVAKQLASFARFIGMSSPTNDERSAERQLICLEAWNFIGNTIHEYPGGRTLRGIELFCMMFVSHLCTNDLTEGSTISSAFKPRHGSNNPNRSSIIRQIVKYLLTIHHHETRNVKQNLRALGRSHARIGIDRDHFDIFMVSFIETLIIFPGVCLTGEHITAWASLLNFALNQMCFDKIVFRDHCTLDDVDDRQTGSSAFKTANESVRSGEWSFRSGFSRSEGSNDCSVDIDYVDC
jgi:hemoglobin-like flavoprotein